MLRVGLTGGIASGKSTVAAMLREEGFTVVDADQIVHRLYEPGNAGYRAIRERYGEAVLRPDGTIDRAALSRVALATPASASELNALIHPLVIAEQEQALSRMDTAVAVVEATLLLESGGRERYDVIVVVDVPEALQLERAVGRGLPRQEAKRRMERQMSRQQRLAAADLVIRNDGSLADLRGQVTAVSRLLRERAGGK